MGRFFQPRHGRQHSPFGSDPALLPHTLLAYFDGSGDVLTTGIKGDAQLRSFYKIVQWTLLADTSGSIQIDIWKDTYTNYPPTNPDSITGGDEPAISGGLKATSDALDNWDIWLVPNDCLRFNIDSVSNITRCCLALHLVEGVRESQS